MHRLHADKSFTLSFFTSAEFPVTLFDPQIDPGLWLTPDLAMSTEPLNEVAHAIDGAEVWDDLVVSYHKGLIPLRSAVCPRLAGLQYLCVNGSAMGSGQYGRYSTTCKIGAWSRGKFVGVADVPIFWNVSA